MTKLHLSSVLAATLILFQAPFASAQEIPPVSVRPINSAEYPLGLQYFIKKDYKTAKMIWEREAKQGCKYSQFNLASMYYSGEGVDKDIKEAKKWFTKAAEQNHPRSQFALGFIAYEGLDGVVDDIKAFKLFDQAAKQGDASSIFFVADAYHHGTHGMPVDYATELQLLKVGADPERIRKFDGPDIENFRKTTGAIQNSLAMMFTDDKHSGGYQSLPLAYALTLLAASSNPSSYQNTLQVFERNITPLQMRNGRHMAEEMSKPNQFIPVFNSITAQHL